MRVIGVLGGLVIALSACGGSTGEDPGVPLGPTPDAGRERTERTVDVYGAVIRQLVTKDHTFGGEPSPFERVYVVDGVVADVGVGAPSDLPRERFPAAVKEGLVRALADLPDVEFVADPDSVIVEKNQCGQVKGGGALISLGPIKGRGGHRVTVANGLFFACLGGQWLTYVLEPAEPGWRVVGTTGPVAVS
jgi:hypothetical protein